MRHEPYASLDELLESETLSRLTGVPIVSARREPFVGGHSASGSEFFALVTNDGAGPRLVVKQSSLADDWIMRATADHRCREVLTWSTGLLERLPAEIAHPVVACARDGEGWAILMRDVGDTLLPEWDADTRISEEDHALVLDALAALHAAFWDDPGAGDPAIGFCSPEHRFTAFSPEMGRREYDHPNPIPRSIAEGWDRFWPLVEPRVADLVRTLIEDPGPLCHVLKRYPQTVVHGDPRAANLGIQRGVEPRLVLLDWHFVGTSVPAGDLAWYLSQIGFQVPVSRETTIAWYREALARRLGSRFDDAWWQPQLELSLLGQFLRMGWINALDAENKETATISAWGREELAWYADWAMAAVRWLG
jgi:hypothetical protein